MIFGGVIGWFIIFFGRGIILDYEKIDAMNDKTAHLNMTKVSLPRTDTPLVIPSLALFKDNAAWMYVSSRNDVPASFEPQNLVDVDLPHGDADQPIKLNEMTAKQLKALFAKADADGIGLMVSSAYRSVNDQQNLYDSFIAKQGQAAADQYVAKPGSSEHHTGYAADITDASAACAARSDACNLSPSTAQWIADNSPVFGFIVRYPSGKQPVTGVAYEPWHLRYIGVAAAQRLSESGLTFDEFIQQVAPGRMSPQ